MSITIIKRDLNGRETLRYKGSIVFRDDQRACIEARFALPTRDLGYLLLKEGDRFIEWFYTDRWYNVFLVHDVEDGRFKGAYCNFTRPSLITPDSIVWDDLALDLWASPLGEVRLLDTEEYDALALADDERDHVRAAHELLLSDLAARCPPFDVISPFRDG